MNKTLELCDGFPSMDNDLLIDDHPVMKDEINFFKKDSYEQK